MYTLPTWEPRTDDPGCSSGPGGRLLPTPTTREHTGPGTPGGPRSDTLRGQVALLPTPAANLGTCGGGQPPERRRAGGHSVGLHDVVEYLPGALLPTPAAVDGARGPDYARAARAGSGGDDLVTSMARLMPTPRASDATKGSPNQKGSRGDVMLTGAVHRLLPTPTATQYGSNQSPSPGAAVRPSLTSIGQAAAGRGRLLPTPVTTDAKSARRTGLPGNPTAGYEVGMTLLDAAISRAAGKGRLLPTPRARDHKGKDPNPNGVDLNQAIADLPGERLLPTPTSADGEGGRTRRGGKRRGEKLLTGIARDAAAASTGAHTQPLFDIGNPCSEDPFPIRS